MKNVLTIEEIENLEGLIFDDSNENLNYSLPLWHKGIRKKKLSELTGGDLARLIRQDMYVKYIIPECIYRLNDDPILGEQYNGELLTALVTKIDKTFWEEHQEYKKEAKDFIKHFYKNINRFVYDNDILEEFGRNKVIELIRQFEKLIE
jgi:hypothetical protein